jgi:hypothetical protein
VPNTSSSTISSKLLDCLSKYKESIVTQNFSLILFITPIKTVANKAYMKYAQMGIEY